MFFFVSNPYSNSVASENLFFFILNVEKKKFSHSSSSLFLDSFRFEFDGFSLSPCFGNKNFFFYLFITQVQQALDYLFLIYTKYICSCVGGWFFFKVVDSFFLVRNVNFLFNSSLMMMMIMIIDQKEISSSNVIYLVWLGIVIE